MEPKLFCQTVPGSNPRRVQCKGCGKVLPSTTFERSHLYSCDELATQRRRVARLFPPRAALPGAADAPSAGCGIGGSSGGAPAALQSGQQTHADGPDALGRARAAGTARPTCSAGSGEGAAAVDLDVPSASDPQARRPPSPGRAAEAPQQVAGQPRAAYVIEDDEAFEDLAAEAGLSEEAYAELCEANEALDVAGLVPQDTEYPVDPSTESESEDEEETASPSGSRGAANRLPERLGCELYDGAGPDKSLLRFAYQTQLWGLRSNASTAALQEMLTLSANCFPPGNLCPATIYQLDRVNRCNAASLAALLGPDNEQRGGCRGGRSAGS